MLLFSGDSSNKDNKDSAYCCYFTHHEILAFPMGGTY